MGWWNHGGGNKTIPNEQGGAGGSEQGRAWVGLLVLWAAGFSPEKHELI